MDYEKILRAYIRHVKAEEGCIFINAWNKPDFMEDFGLSDAEADRLLAIGEEIDPHG